jgi:hypothetical protein
MFLPSYHDFTALHILKLGHGVSEIQAEAPHFPASGFATSLQPSATRVSSSTVRPWTLFLGNLLAGRAAAAAERAGTREGARLQISTLKRRRGSIS